MLSSFQLNRVQSPAVPRDQHGSRKICRLACRAHTVEFKRLDGSAKKVEVEEGDVILDALLDAGLDPTHDCKMGVCMTCPARVTQGEVDQGAAMLSEDVRENGYALMCMATPLSDVVIQEVSEAEILDQQLGE